MNQLLLTYHRFFYNFGPRNPETDIHDVPDSEIVDRLVAGQSFSHPSYHLDWFNIEVEPMTGVDVYSHGRFPVELGSTVYSGYLGERHTDLLTFRLEDLSQVGAQALAGFYGKPIQEIKPVNTADEQAYSDRYKAFKRNVKLPIAWVAWQLNSQYAQFFYTEDERAKFAERWRGDSTKIK